MVKQKFYPVSNFHITGISIVQSVISCCESYFKEDDLMVILFSFWHNLSGINGQIMRADFERIIKGVADAADLNPCQLLCKRRFPETMDARWIAVKLLKEEGFYSSQIARLMNMTTRNVNHIIYSVEIRLSKNDKSLEYLLETSRKHLRKSQEISSLNG